MKAKRNVRRVYSLVAIALLSVAGSSAWAQVTASISGRIEDASGAAIPEAAVTATNLETGASRSVDTDEAGNYRALSLPVGRYEVRVRKPGFKELVQSGINLTVGQQAVVNLRLEVGEVQQQVTVTAAAEMVNTTTASVSGLVGEQQVKDLPLNGRSFDQLITLNAGAVNYSGHSTMVSAGGGEGNYFTVAGRTPYENLFLLNGVQYTGGGFQTNTPGGASGQLLGVDAIREFNVLSGTYSAEYGQRPGGQVTLVTQSGSNQLHGSLFEFLRNSKLDARNFFDRTPGLAIPPFKRNQFGGAAGGPIRKDKTFIFGNYEGFRQRLGLSVVTFVPDLNARQGLLPNAQGVPTPVPGLNTGMLPYLAYWPLPNGPNLGGGIAETFSNPAQVIREDYGTTRFDENFSTKDTLSAAYTIDDGFNQTPLVDPLFATVIALRNQLASLQETHIFSPQVINTARVGFSRGAFEDIAGPLSSFPSNLSFATGRLPGTIVFGAASVGGGSSLTQGGGTRNSVVITYRSLFTYQDGIQVVKGKHQISAGVFLQRVRANEFGIGPTTGFVTFTNLQSFLQGNLAQIAVITDPHFLNWRVWEGAWYLEDVIQLRPNLTLSLGLRHEFSNGWNEDKGRAANFALDANGFPITTPVTGGSLFAENNTKWLFGPRVGLAWDPFGKGKTSIRAGFGTHYWLVDNTLGSWPGGNPPFNGQVTFTNTPFLSAVPINPNTPTPPSCGPGVPAPCTTYTGQGVTRTSKAPTLNSWNFMVEQQLTPNTALRVAYLGSRGFHYLINKDPNTVPAQICSNAGGCTSGGVGSARGTVPQGAQYIPVAATLPNPYLASGQFTFFEGNNWYNALQVEFTKRLSHGLQFRGNYTWSRLLDNSSSITTASTLNQAAYIMNPRDLHRDWGPSPLNVTHQANGNLSYELPFGRGKAWLQGASGVADKLVSGWQVNGIVSLLSGFDSSALAGSNRSGDGDLNAPDRANVNPAFTGPLILGDPNRWFNPNAFLLPTAGTYGNVGKGTIIGPGFASVDFSLFKTTRITERVGLQFRAEFFNILNHANFASPVGAVFSGTSIGPSAGRITGTVTTSRQIQFGLKLSF